MNEPWQAPEWMLPYIQHIQITGKYTVDELMNNTTTTVQDNPAKNLRIISVRAQVKLLKKLHEAGIIQ